MIRAALSAHLPTLVYRWKLWPRLFSVGMFIAKHVRIH